MFRYIIFCSVAMVLSTAAAIALGLSGDWLGCGVATVGAAVWHFNTVLEIIKFSKERYARQ